MIKLDIRPLEEMEEMEILRTMNKVLQLHFFERDRIQELEDMYAGKCGAFNKAKMICDTATSTFIGTAPDLITRAKAKSESKKLDLFQEKLTNNRWEEELQDTAKFCSKDGSGFLCIYNEKGDKFPRFKTLNSLDTNVVYTCEIEPRPLFAFAITNVDRFEKNVKKSYYRIYVYTERNCFVFETRKSVGVFSCAFVPFLLQDGGEVNMFPHDFNGVPVIEFFNNREHKGDAECVKDLIMKYNELQETRIVNVKEVVNYLLVLKNVRVGNEEESKAVEEMLREQHILAIEGENVDAKFLTNPLDQEQMDILSKVIEENIEYISRVPNLAGEKFSQNASEPILKMKTKPLLDLAKEKELTFNKSLIKVLKIVLDYVERFDTESEKIMFDLDKVAVNYTHSLPSNDTDMVNAIVNLTNSGMANPSVLLDQLSFIKNVPSYIEGMEDFNESVAKRKNISQNNNNGLNQHNLELQNAKPQTSDTQDNRVNATLGESKKLSENK